MHDAALDIVGRDGFAAARAETEPRRTMRIRMSGERPTTSAEPMAPPAP